jgi:diguanylate cyclase
MHAQAHYARTSRMDALTGLFNRRWLDEVLERQCRRCAEGTTAMSLILVDIDHFKQVNDRFGHLFGDEALKAVANHLRMNTRPLDVAARFGGEEFAVLLHGLDLRGAVEVAEQIRNDIGEAEILGSDAQMRLTVSIGVAQLQEFEQPMTLLQNADRALYEAKHLGRNRVVTATEFSNTGLA